MSASVEFALVGMGFMAGIAVTLIGMYLINRLDDE